MTHPPRTRRNKEATRAALLRAGGDAFGRHGFEGATLDGIAERAGVNKAMIAYYFGDKAGLFQAVLQEAVDYILARVIAEIETVDDPAQQLQRYIKVLGEMMAARPFFPAMLVRDYQSGRFQQDPELVVRLMKFSQITKRIVDDGMASGVFRKTDYHSLHLSIIGALAIFIATQRFRDEVGSLPGREEEVAPQLAGFCENLAATILGGIQA